MTSGVRSTSRGIKFNLFSYSNVLRLSTYVTLLNCQLLDDCSVVFGIIIIIIICGFPIVKLYAYLVFSS